MNGVTGRMGSNQHLMRSIVAIMRQGGVRLNDREVVMPDPILVGRNAQRLEQLAARSGIVRWTTDLGKALDDVRSKVSEAKRLVKEYLWEHERLEGYSPREVMRMGIGFLEENGLGRVEDRVIRATARDEVDYYAGLMME